MSNEGVQPTKELVVDDNVEGDKAPSDEEEGEDVFDSSEEDEDLDEDEEEAKKVREGFIVDDDEEGRASAGRKRGKKHKRRPREDEDDKLSEDDLDLLMENAGVKRPVSTDSNKAKLKRLKRAGDNGSEEPSDSTAQGPTTASRFDDFFSEDEDEGPEKEQPSVEDEAAPSSRRNADVGTIDELDDFIEEDEFSDEDEESRQQRLEERKMIREQRMNQPVQITGLSSEKIDEMYDIFGDGHDYDWALEVENEEFDQVEGGDGAAGNDDEFDAEGSHESRKPKITLQDIYDLQDLRKNLLTEEDMVIRRADIPERYQELRAGLKNYGELGAEDQELEKNWISDKLCVDKNFDPDFDLSEFKEAVGNAIKFVSKDNMEVPFIYAYRRNYISSKEKDGFVLNEDDLWEIVYMDSEFHSIIYKRDYVKNFYKLLGIEDPIVDEYFRNQASSMTELTSLQDIYNYLEFKFAHEINEALLTQSNGSTKKHMKNSSYERFKSSPLYKAVNDIGITSDQVGENIHSEHQIHPVIDHPDSKPQQVIADIMLESSADLQVFTTNHKLALETVQKYYSLEIANNPKVREKVRADFYKYYIADVVLSVKGKKEIQRGSPYEDIKYAINRTPVLFRKEPEVFLRMLEAESLHLMTVKIHMSSQAQYCDHLFQTALDTTNTSEIATEWNDFRKGAFLSALDKIFLEISQEIKDDLRKSCQKLVSKAVRHKFMTKLDQAPYIPNPRDPKIPRVLAVTCGQGRFGSDAIIAVYVNRKSDYVRDYKIVDNPFDRSNPEKFEETLDNIIQACQPNVIAINGPNPKTQRLVRKIQEVIQKKQIVDNRGHNIPVIYVEDELATRYQSSERGIAEFPNKPSLVKYCIALARYVHSPLLEYVNLSPDELMSLSIHPSQSLLTKDNFMKALETSFVDLVNLVGVEVNKSTDNGYYARCLQYISGLGKRKATDFLESLQRLNEPLLARQQLITHNILHKTIFMNSAGFLYISWNQKNQRYEDLQHDQLDSTRIHPEDYHLATKVAADALEYDPDDIAEKDEQGAMSEFIEILRDDSDCKAKLESLNLDAYAEELEKNTGQKKLNSLNTIVLELLNGFEELRNDFRPLHGEDVFTTLTGETDKTFFKGCIVPVKVERFRHSDIICATNSLVECIVNAQRHLGAQLKRPASELYEIGMTYPAKVIFIDYENISAEVSLLEHDVKHQFVPVHYSKDPSVWDLKQELEDGEEEKKIAMREARAKRTHRVINHPYYFPFNGQQAEDYLRSKERGDFVIRQSSRGDDHLSITWKLDKDLFQHIDIVEQEKENPLALGRILLVEGQRYHDLDQIVVEYLQNKVRLLNEITSNEKFKRGTKREVTKFIEDYSKVNPNRSVYYFSFNYENPGWFFLMFKINAQSKLYTWNVRLTHTGFFLVNYNYPTVIQLCNGFKTLLKTSNRTQRPGSAVSSAPTATAGPAGGYYGY